MKRARLRRGRPLFVIAGGKVCGSVYSESDYNDMLKKVKGKKVRLK